MPTIKQTTEHHMRQILLILGSLLFAVTIKTVKTEKDFILIQNSTLANGTWDEYFTKTLQEHCHKRSELYLDTHKLSIPSFSPEKESKEQCSQILQKFPTCPKVVVVIGATGWHISSSLFDNEWKGIPVILCHPLSNLPNSLNTLLNYETSDSLNTTTAQELQKHYNLNLL